MLHVTCDLCGKDVVQGEDHHYVVRIAVYPSRDPSELTEDDLDSDHMEAVSQLLRDMEEGNTDGEELQPPRKNFRYDLCLACHRKFVRDPLARDGSHKFDFSEN